VDTEVFTEAFSKETGMPLEGAIRVSGPGMSTRVQGGELELALRHPSGFEAVWPRLDFYEARTQPSLAEGVITIRNEGQRRAPREWWATLVGADTTGMELTVSSGGDTQTGVSKRNTPRHVGEQIVTAGDFTADWALVPSRRPR
jgi:hypothetical protein